MIVTCTFCHATFSKHPSQIQRTNNHFCSSSCSAKYNNKKKPKRQRKEKQCLDCQVMFFGTSTQKRCQQCLIEYKTSNAFKSMSLEEYTNKMCIQGKHPSWKHAHIRNFNRSWNKDLTKKPCQVCGYNKHVELAHIKAISSFSPDTSLSVINDPKNIAVLCRNCHWELDHGLLSLEVPCSIH